MPATLGLNYEHMCITSSTKSKQYIMRLMKYMSLITQVYGICTNIGICTIPIPKTAWNLPTFLCLHGFWITCTVCTCMYTYFCINLHMYMNITSCSCVGPLYEYMYMVMEICAYLVVATIAGCSSGRIRGETNVPA